MALDVFRSFNFNFLKHFRQVAMLRFFGSRCLQVKGFRSAALPSDADAMC